MQLSKDRAEFEAIFGHFPVSFQLVVVCKILVKHLYKLFQISGHLYFQKFFDQTFVIFCSICVTRSAAKVLLEREHYPLVKGGVEKIASEMNVVVKIQNCTHEESLSLFTPSATVAPADKLDYYWLEIAPIK